MDFVNLVLDSGFGLVAGDLGLNRDRQVLIQELTQELLKVCLVFLQLTQVLGLRSCDSVKVKF